MEQHEIYWRNARLDYLDGVSVSKICLAYNFPRSTFYARARREGWLRPDDDDRRKGQRCGDEGPLEPALPTIELARLAMDRASRAIQAGDLKEAAGWTRLARQMRDLAKEECAGTTWTFVTDRHDKAEAAKATTREPATLDTCPMEEVEPTLSVKKDSASPLPQLSNEIPDDEPLEWAGFNNEQKVAALTQMARDFTRLQEARL